MFKPNSQFRTKGFLAYANAMASEHISIFRRELTNHFISNKAAPQSAYVRGLAFSGRSIKYQSLTLHNRREQAHSLTRAIPTYDSHRLTNPALRPSAHPWCIPTLDGAGIILPKIRKKTPAELRMDIDTNFIFGVRCFFPHPFSDKRASRNRTARNTALRSSLLYPVSHKKGQRKVPLAIFSGHIHNRRQQNNATHMNTIPKAPMHSKTDTCYPDGLFIYNCVPPTKKSSDTYEL